MQQLRIKLIDDNQTMVLGIPDGRATQDPNGVVISSTIPVPRGIKRVKKGRLNKLPLNYQSELISATFTIMGNFGTPGATNTNIADPDNEVGVGAIPNWMEYLLDYYSEGKNVRLSENSSLRWCNVDISTTEWIITKFDVRPIKFLGPYAIEHTYTITFEETV